MSLCEGAPETGPFSLLYTTLPGKESAESIARDMVQDGCAACINIFDNITSVYKDTTRVCVENEVSILIKTTCLMRNRAFVFLKKKHPYTTPAILTWEGQCNKPFEAWMQASTLANGTN